jgi:hypothetical protein
MNCAAGYKAVKVLTYGYIISEARRVVKPQTG